MAGSSDPYAAGPGMGATGLQPHASLDVESRRADEGKTVTFRSQTALVQVPVVVTDAAGQHIHGLSKADFKVLEEGKAQNITGFEEVTAAGGPMAVLEVPAGAATNLFTGETAPHALTLIVLDEVNTPFLRQAAARSQLIKYLGDHLNSSRPLGVVVIGEKGVSVLAPLNSDPARVVAALKKAGSETAQMERFSDDAQSQASLGARLTALGGISPGESEEAVFAKFKLREDSVLASYTQSRAIEITLRGFLAIALSLSGEPGRKSLVWVTGGFPFLLDSYTDAPADANLRALYERLLKALNDAQISVYPLDARGLLSDPTFSAAGSGSQLGAEAPALLAQAELTSLKMFADMTGGVAYYNTNDLSDAFGRAVQDSASYYLLTYRFDQGNRKSGWRRLRVQVARRQAVVRARAGYMVTNLAVNPEMTHNADIDFALSSPLESTAIGIVQQWEGREADGGKKKIAFVVQAPAAELIDENDKNRIDAELIAQATKDGVIAGSVTQNSKGLVVPETLAKLQRDGVVYRNYFELPPGNYQVRFIIRNNLNGKIGSLILPLAVN